MAFWVDLTSHEIHEKLISGYTSAILPFGSIEQHGKHLNVSYDYLIAERLSYDLSRKHSKAFILPTFQYGLSEHHVGFSGTLTISKKTAEYLLDDLISSLANHGLKELIIINGHGGNYNFIKSYNNKYKNKISIFHDANKKFIFKASELFDDFSKQEIGLHGGLYETSLAMFTHPNAVRVNKLNYKTKYIEVLPETIFKEGLKKYYPQGIIGDPTKSSKSIGEKYYQHLLEFYIDEFIK